MQIKRDSFSESSELLVLNLRQNKLGSLSKDDLYGLDNLVTLNIGDNELDNITSDAFSHCTNLQTLDVSGNKLDQLHPFIFKGDVQMTLRELYLARNFLGAVPKAALHGLQHLSVLDLSENRISVISNGDFEAISPRLLELKLSGCGLHTIAGGAFYGLGSLKVLDLSDNGLTEAPNSAFQNVPLLETLNIGRNKMRSISGRDFLFLPKLKHFDLNGCNTESFTLDKGLFSQNTNLESIKIRCPTMTSVSEDASLKHLSMLQNLSFHGSGLETLPWGLANYQDLVSLDLGSNPLHCDCSLVNVFSLMTLPQPVKVIKINIRKLLNRVSGQSWIMFTLYFCCERTLQSPMFVPLSV